jgi:hypothetical protein
LQKPTGNINEGKYIVKALLFVIPFIVVFDLITVSLRTDDIKRLFKDRRHRKKNSALIKYGRSELRIGE